MPEFLQSINTLVKNWHTNANNVTTELFSEGDSLIEAHLKNPFDIIFLDIVMPLINGIDTASLIRKNDSSVKLVFLTSSAEFAVESYSVHANGYILKPIEEDKFYRCLDELYAETHDNSEYLLIRDSISVHRVDLQKIEYVEAQGKHVIFSLSDGTNLTSDKPLYFYDNLLLAEDGFLKCHRSYIVNVFRIKKYTAKEITMKSGFRIPISRNCHKDFEAAFFELNFGKAGEF